MKEFICFFILQLNWLDVYIKKLKWEKLSLFAKFLFVIVWECRQVTIIYQLLNSVIKRQAFLIEWKNIYLFYINRLHIANWCKKEST